MTALFTIMLDPSTSGWSPDRFADALLDSGVALGVRAVSPSDPRHIVERAAHPIFDDITGALRETAVALRAGNLEMAEHALRKARETDGRMGSFREARDAGYDTARRSPARRRALGQLGLYATAAYQLDLAVRNIRVLARHYGDGARGAGSPRGALRNNPRPQLVPSRPSRGLHRGA